MVDSEELTQYMRMWLMNYEMATYEAATLGGDPNRVKQYVYTLIWEMRSTVSGRTARTPQARHAMGQLRLAFPMSVFAVMDWGEITEDLVGSMEPLRYDQLPKHLRNRPW